MTTPSSHPERVSQYRNNLLNHPKSSAFYSIGSEWAPPPRLQDRHRPQSSGVYRVPETVQEQGELITFIRKPTFPGAISPSD